MNHLKDFNIKHTTAKIDKLVLEVAEKNRKLNKPKVDLFFHFSKGKKFSLAEIFDLYEQSIANTNIQMEQLKWWDHYFKTEIIPFILGFQQQYKNQAQNESYRKLLLEFVQDLSMFMSKMKTVYQNELQAARDKNLESFIDEFRRERDIYKQINWLVIKHYNVVEKLKETKNKLTIVQVVYWSSLFVPLFALIAWGGAMIVGAHNNEQKFVNELAEVGKNYLPEAFAMLGVNIAILLSGQMKRLEAQLRHLKDSPLTEPL